MPAAPVDLHYAPADFLPAVPGCHFPVVADPCQLVLTADHPVAGPAPGPGPVRFLSHQLVVALQILVAVVKHHSNFIKS